MNIAIVVIGYKDAYKISRLLKSLAEADYLGDSVPLYISIDNSGTTYAEDVARNFVWKNGRKEVITHENRLGLRRHILKCGELLDRHDALIVLEDDLLVSKDFYSFACQAVNKYASDSSIAGISLYSHKWNVHAKLPFEPCLGSHDAFFLQFAQSWGQVWLKNTWKEFATWYEENKDRNLFSDYVPVNVTSWPTSSWLKYHIAFCIAKDKYFVYPYESLTTCFNEAGQHNKVRNSLYQVQLYEPGRKEYRFADFDSKEAIKYDAFFERVGLGDCLSLKDDELEIDIYGYKPIFEGKRYLLSSRSMGYKVMKSWGLDMKPHEKNVFIGIEGDQLYLYDLSQTAKAPRNPHDSRWYDYYYRIPTGVKAGILFSSELLISRIRELIVKKLK